MATTTMSASKLFLYAHVLFRVVAIAAMGCPDISWGVTPPMENVVYMLNVPLFPTINIDVKDGIVADDN